MPSRPALGDGMRERRLADLPGPDEGDGGLTVQSFLNLPSARRGIILAN
jgi:hypothetical protein